jgi:hypothetical protein
MDLRRIAAFTLLIGAGLTAGCLSTPKAGDLARVDPTPEKSPATAGAATPGSAADGTAAPDPKDPLGPGMTPKYTAFLKSEGLTMEPAKLGEAARLTAGWKPAIAFAPDPLHGGEPVPGLVARVWVFGPDEGVPLDPDGELIAGVWDMSARNAEGEPKLLELWCIDRETAKKFVRRDSIGNGYSLFLPWGSYHVDLKQVSVILRYNSAGGRSIASAPQTLTLDHSATLQRAAEKLGVSGKPETGNLPVKFGPTK